MRPLHLTITLFFFLLPLINWAQETTLLAKDSVVVSSWLFGVGFNAVDDAGSEFQSVFNFNDNWNVLPFPSRLSVGKNFKSGVGLEAVGTYNQYQEGKTVDGTLVSDNIDYYALDLRVNYDLNMILGETGFFDPYVGIGVGYTDANNQGRGTYNASVGFRTWFSDKWALDFSSTGKWTMNSDNSTNHLQHAAGVVYRFGTERGLSNKGMEKLALLKKFEEEQRIQDSITSANNEKKAAKVLADRLKREEEAAKLAELEKSKLQQRQAKTNLIAREIKDLGAVYFNLNSSYLTSNDKALLDNLVAILNRNLNAVIGITSHTDSRGTDQYNQWLSEQRLGRILDYLTKKGIDAKRIESSAQGEANLANECDDEVYCPEEKHKVNRRSEIELLRI